MGRPKGSNRVPTLRHHKPSGRAVVTIAGRDFYAGAWDVQAGRPSVEATRKYKQLVGEYLVCGQAKESIPPVGVTIRELCASYWTFAESYYHSSRGHLSSVKRGISALLEAHGDLPTGELSPLKLAGIRDRLVTASRDNNSRGPVPGLHRHAAGHGWSAAAFVEVRGERTYLGRYGDAETWAKYKRFIVAELARPECPEPTLSRRYINTLIIRIRHIFRWGTANELVPAGVYDRLKTIEGLKIGKTVAREKPKVRPVSDADITATLPWLTPVVAAMVQVQRLTGMRSGELVIMRTGDIDRSDKEWVYRPRKHKTQHHDMERAVPIGPIAQEIIQPFLKLDPDAFIFTPEGSWNSWVEAKWGTDKARANRPSKIRRKFNASFSVTTYAGAITNAIARAKRRGTSVPHWFPHQLRHSCATELASKFGLDAASAQLGHHSPDVTLIYAERDLGKAKRAMREVG